MNRWLAGQIFWPLTERLIGRDTMRRYRQLRASDHDAVSAITARQTAKLRRSLMLADAHSPFYRRRFRAAALDPRDPDLGLDTLARLPLLNRADVRDHLDEMTWRDCPGGPARVYSTGGSTGEPLRFYIDRCRQAADWAARWRARDWWNLRPGDREIMLWAGPSSGTTPGRLRVWRDRLLNQSVLDAFDMTAETMASYAARIRSVRPRLLYGYASSLALLARHMLKTGDTLADRQSPRAVFVTGETVTPRDSSDIQAAFGARVVIEYGSRDCGFLAGACPAGRLHVADENVIVEVLDPAGRPVGPGEVGEVVVTCLEAFASTLIRYRLGDLAQVPPEAGRQLDGRCVCGRASRQLLEVRGRLTDQIVCRDGDSIRHMHALSIIYVLREAEGLRQFRVVQDSLRDLDIEVVADDRFTPAVQAAVLRDIRQRMGPDVAVRITRRDRIAPTAAGKHACVISNVEMCRA
ncbi:MAG: phenylacetate--CoA ligase family protein [Planctomycetes bacterium]|nr:phenylacetate--CoA ligase family protein [Planctomycetota bacterium]